MKPVKKRYSILNFRNTLFLTIVVQVESVGWTSYMKNREIL